MVDVEVEFQFEVMLVVEGEQFVEFIFEDSGVEKFVEENVNEEGIGGDNDVKDGGEVDEKKDEEKLMEFMDDKISEEKRDDEKKIEEEEQGCCCVLV